LTEGDALLQIGSLRNIAELMLDEDRFAESEQLGAPHRRAEQRFLERESCVGQPRDLLGHQRGGPQRQQQRES